MLHGMAPAVSGRPDARAAPASHAATVHQTAMTTEPDRRALTLWRTPALVGDSVDLATILHQQDLLALQLHHALAAIGLQCILR